MPLRLRPVGRASLLRRIIRPLRQLPEQPIGQTERTQRSPLLLIVLHRRAPLQRISRPRSLGLPLPSRHERIPIAAVSPNQSASRQRLRPIVTRFAGQTALPLLRRIPENPTGRRIGRFGLPMICGTIPSFAQLRRQATAPRPTRRIGPVGTTRWIEAARICSPGIPLILKTPRPGRIGAAS